MINDNNNTAGSLEHSLKKMLKNYPGGIPARLMIETEVIDINTQKNEASGPKIVLLMPVNPGSLPAEEAFLNDIAQKGLKLKKDQYLVLPASEFSQNFEKYSSVKFIVAFGLGIYSMLYEGQNLASAKSLNDYRGVGMLIADQASEIMNNPAKKKVFWENLKSNVIDKKII